MSVTHPADSGGGGGSIAAVDRDKRASNMFEEMAQEMQNVGDWAEIMEQEYVHNSDNNNFEDEANVVDKEGTPRSKRHVPDSPPFKVQVSNVASNVHPEQVVFFFGGDDVVKDMQKLDDKFILEFDNKQSLIEATLKDGKVLGTNEIRVFVLRNQTDRPAPIAERKQSYHNDARRSNDYNSGHVNNYGGRQGSQYNSQSSLYSNDARSNYGNRRGGPSEHRGYSSTLPGRGGYSNNQHHGDRNDYGGYGGRGGRLPRGGGGGGGYDNRYGQRNDYQRSGSYAHDRDYAPGPINRSRTDSMASDQYRRSDMQSRNSSRLSVETETADNKVPVKKATAKDIFGEAKPVDTEARIREVEKRREKERQATEQKAKDEAAVQLAEKQDHHGHSHHRNHHQPRNHAPSPPHHGGYGNHMMTQEYVCPPPLMPQYALPQVESFTTPPPQWAPQQPIKILQRQPPPVEPFDSPSDPPIDPHHNDTVKATSFEPIQEVSSSANQVKDEKLVVSVGQDKNMSIDADKAARMTSSHHSIGSNGEKVTKYRTFHRSNEYQKSDSSHQIHDRPRGGHSTRGRGRGGGQHDRRSSYSSNDPKAVQGEESLNTEPLSNKQSVDGPARSPRSTSDAHAYNKRQQGRPEQKPQQGNTLPRPEKKEHHGSRSSLRGRGGFDRVPYKAEDRQTKPAVDEKSTESGKSYQRSNYGHHGRGAGLRTQQNRRSSKTSIDDLSKTTENRKDAVDNKISKEEFVPHAAGKNGAGDTVPKPIEVVKVSADTTTVTLSADNTPTDKKKDKKKNKNPSSKTSNTALTGNKFALLLACDE